MTGPIASIDDMIHQIALRVHFLQGVVFVTHDVEREVEDMCSHSTHNPLSVIRPQPFMVVNRIKLQ